MFDAAKEKIKNWWANPYWAPITEPLKMIGTAAYAPNAGFVKAIRDGAKEPKYPDKDNNPPKLPRIFSEMASYRSGFVVSITATMGAAIAGIAGGIGGGALLASAGYGIPAIIAGGIAAAGLSAVAFPFVVMAGVGFAGAVVGAVASPWGVGKGILKAVKHHQFQKTQAAVVQTTPALQTAAPEAQETAARIFTQLRDLPAELQAPVLKSLSESFAATGTGAAGSIMKSIEALPDADRKALVRELQSELALTFDAVATEQAQDSITLQEAASTMPALRFKKR